MTNVIDLAHIKQKNCLILGAGGFIGLNLTKYLTSFGACVTGYGHSSPFPEVFKDINFIVGDLADTDKLDRILPRTDYVFHLLGDSSPTNSSLNSATSIDKVKASLELLNLAHKHSAEKIIFASSGGAIYGKPSILPIPESMNTNPINAYGINMLMLEKYLSLYQHIHGLNSVILRISNPYGPYQLNLKKQGIIAAIMENAYNDKDIEIWGDGEVVRDFIYIDDVCEAFVKAALYKGEYNLFNCGSGIGRSINSVVSDIETILNIGKFKINYTTGRKIDIAQNYLDINLIKTELDWQPKTQWLPGLKSTSDWFTSHLKTKYSLKP